MDDDNWGDDDDNWGDEDANDGEDAWADEEEIGRKLSDISVDGLKSTKKIDYVSLDQDGVNDHLKNVLKDFGQMIDTEPPYDDAKLILQYYDWNVDLAKNKYFMGDQSLVRINSGIDVHNKNNNYDYMSDTEMKSVESDDEDMEKEVECPVCLDDFSYNKTSALTCGHRVCSDCWSQYIIHSSKASACFRLTCPHAGCEVAATTTRLIQIGVNKTHVEQLQKRSFKFSTKHFTSHNKNLIECLGQDCPYVIQLRTTKDELIKNNKLEVTCKGGHSYCIGCDTNGHNPCSCKVASAWKIKATSESENMKWILARTKKCPKCRTPIEKNQGCNHITCTKCKHEWCWLCKGNWDEHGSGTGGYYKCNIFEKKKETGENATDEEKTIAKAKSELERYQFYFSRYENHMRSITFMKKTLEKALKRTDDLMIKYQWKPNEASFIKEACLTTMDCRRLLAWSYPIGYYMDQEFVQRDLFHQYQKDLEQYTEKLHELTEQKLDVFKDQKKRAEVINYQRVITSYRTNLIIGIKNEINPKCKFLIPTE